MFVGRLTFWLAPWLALLFVLSLPTSASANTYVHEVLPGESLRSIAKQYKTTTKKIKRTNRLRGNRLRAGRKLKIATSYPARPQRKVRYRVRSGDTLAKIAHRHKMSLRMMRRLNRRAAKRLLRPGQKLWVVRRGKRPSGRRVRGLVQLTAGPGFTIRDRHRAWGSFLTVMRLMDVMGDYDKVYPDAEPVRVHDISRSKGGYFYPHKSHRFGRDVDIVYPVKPKYAGVLRPKARMVDLERTWFLVNRFIKTKDVTYIFMDKRLQRMVYTYALALGEDKTKLRKLFQHPRGRPGAVIRHEPGHAAHLHVRFRPAKKVPPPNA